MPQAVIIPKETLKAIEEGALKSKDGKALTKDEIHVETKQERLKRHKRRGNFI